MRKIGSLVPLALVCTSIALISGSAFLAYFKLVYPYDLIDITTKEYLKRENRWNNIPAWAALNFKWTYYLLINKLTTDTDGNTCSIKLISRTSYIDGVLMLVQWADDSIFIYNSNWTGPERIKEDIKEFRIRINKINDILQSQTEIQSLKTNTPIYDEHYGEGIQVAICTDGSILNYKLPFNAELTIRGSNSDSIPLDEIIKYLNPKTISTIKPFENIKPVKL